MNSKLHNPTKPKILLHKKSQPQNFVRMTLDQEAKEKINSGCIEGVISTFFEPATTLFKYFFITPDITMFSITSEK